MVVGQAELGPGADHPLGADTPEHLSFERGIRAGQAFADADERHQRAHREVLGTGDHRLLAVAKVQGGQPELLRVRVVLQVGHPADQDLA